VVARLLSGHVEEKSESGQRLDRLLTRAKLAGLATKGA